VLLTFWKLVFSVDRVSWAFWFAKCAIDTFIRIDYQKVWAFMKAIDRANVNAVGEFAFDTVFGDYKSHIVNPKVR
jgi:hypothetical protein